MCCRPDLKPMNNDKTLENTIVSYLKAGDERAFRYIYDTYYSGLCRVAKGYLTDAHLSEAIVGDVIYNLWEKHETIEIRSSLKNYLYRSVANKCISFLELEFMKRETSYTMQDIATMNSLWSLGDDPLGRMMNDETDEKIREAIDKLPPETRQVFCLRRFENKKYEEIAEITGISVNTVKYHLKSAVVKLKEYLKFYLSLMIALIFSNLN